MEPVAAKSKQKSGPELSALQVAAKMRLELVSTGLFNDGSLQANSETTEGTWTAFVAGDKRIGGDPKHTDFTCSLSCSRSAEPSANGGLEYSVWSKGVSDNVNRVYLGQSLEMAIQAMKESAVDILSPKK